MFTFFPFNYNNSLYIDYIHTYNIPSCELYYVPGTTSNVTEPVCTHTHTAYYSTDYMYTGTSTVPGTLYFLKIKINTCNKQIVRDK